MPAPCNAIEGPQLIGIYVLEDAQALEAVNTRGHQSLTTDLVNRPDSTLDDCDPEPLTSEFDGCC